jgi:putative transposon-encoded protein
MPKTSIKMNNMDFETVVRKFGNTGHITVPVSLVGKKVRVKIETL